MSIPANVPLLLLPVRIETRFGEGERGSELWLRIFPDTISISSFEPDLTAGEIAAGQAYWQGVWAAGTPPPGADDALRAPWRALAAAYTPQRAAWIARALTPTNLGSADPAPTFPSPATRASSWQQPAVATALPDAWTVLLYSGSNVATYTSSPVVPPLAVSLTPGDGAFPDGLPVDAGMRWLVDFDAAVAAGMALRIPLAADARRSGFDRIIVFGTSSADAPLGPLLDAHHYTDGLAFVPQGGPTNNTTDGPSIYSRKDPNFDTSFDVERGATLDADANSDGALAASLLGVPAETFAHVRFADGTGTRNGRDMLAALWPATLGYFMDQMMSPVFTDDQIETARQYARDNAVPRGLLPALRTGKTPYGILPVTSLRAYPRRGQRETAELALVEFLERLLPLWVKSAPSAPHIGASNDPDADLLAVLGMDASSMTFHGRRVLGDDVMWNYLLFLNLPQTPGQEWWVEHLQRGRALLDSLGLNAWDPRVLRTSMGEDTYGVPFPTVQDGPLSETDPLAADATVDGTAMNYIEWLNSASLDDIRAENYPGPTPTSLLYKILRQSILLDYVTTAGSAQVAMSVLDAAALREREIVDVAAAQQPAITPWDILARPSPPQPALTWAQYLRRLPSNSTEYERLGELRASLSRLASLSTAELDRLLTETLDACSHRLDVWVTAVANALLQRSRSGGQNATSLGAYGWVEGVKPAQSATDSAGFIHAPSLTQAAAAAVLRNGYVTHQGTADAGLLSIDLSSERVQRALWILEGVQQGQLLGALLGYRFETGLHENNLDIYTQPFRDKFPIVGDKLTPASTPGVAVAPSDVVDGVALRTAWENGELSATGDWGPNLPPAGTDRNAVIALLGDLDDTMDAIADLSLAEETYQLVRGNFGRAGGAMDAISRGLRPPEIQIVETPRSGVTFTQRLLVLLGDSAADADDAGAGRPRALADPLLDAWLRAQLPDPSVVRCTVFYTVAGVTDSVVVSLASLDLGPLDAFAICDASDRPALAELEQRILAQAAPPANASTVNIVYAPAGLPAGTITFVDFLAAARTLRDLVQSARPLQPKDCTLPENDPAAAGGAVDLTDLQARATAVRAKLAADIAALSSAAATVTTAPDGVRAALLACSYYGIPGSIAAFAATTDDLAAQAATVLGVLQQRQTQSLAIDITTADATGLTSAITAIVTATVVPRFTPPNAASLQAAFAESSTLAGGDAFAAWRWLTQLSHVRPAAGRLDDAALAAQVLAGVARAPLQLAQLPQIDNDRWLALPLGGTTPGKGRVAFAAVAAGDPSTQATYSGLLIDDWPERIPSTTESAGVAFHYDEPKSRAPQAALLAVCPDERETWDAQILQAILEETLDLAKVRTIDVDSIQDVGQILPALYFALNLQGATVSMHLLEAVLELRR